MDNEIKENTIGNNIKRINLNNINNGTQKLLTGIVRSGDYSYASQKAEAIGNDTSKYSKVNSITLTGTHVADDEAHTETRIEKTVYFAVDWHGDVNAAITNVNQRGNLEEAINKTNGTLNLNFNVSTMETKQQLILKKSVLEGTIPELNGYAPISVKLTNSSAELNYQETTRTFKIEKQSTLNEETGMVTNTLPRQTSYNLCVTYPLEAYESLGADTVEIRVPVTAYYEGYNNTNSEFTNPQVSNIEKATIIATYRKPEGTVAIFDVTVGKLVTTPSYRNIVSKKKPLRIYHGISEKEEQDNYVVQWTGHTGSNGNTTGMIMKETTNEEAQVTDEFVKTDKSSESMENVTTNIGIYFSNPANMLGEEGWIKVYDDETDELLATFTKENWNSYNANKQIGRAHV